MPRRKSEKPLLGEWACLGIIYPAKTHGFAIASRLKPSGDVGRVWSLSRPLTYRALEQLTLLGYIRAVGEEPGISGGNRTILAATRTGRHQFRTWMQTPAQHLRDLRSELLLKLVLADVCEIDLTDMLERQRVVVEEIAANLQESSRPQNGSVDVVALWRRESSRAALRFLDALSEVRSG